MCPFWQKMPQLRYPPGNIAMWMCFLLLDDFPGVSAWVFHIYLSFLMKCPLKSRNPIKIPIKAIKIPSKLIEIPLKSWFPLKKYLFLLVPDRGLQGRFGSLLLFDASKGALCHQGRLSHATRWLRKDSLDHSEIEQWM